MKKKLIYQVVYEAIEKKIRAGEWKPGDKIPTVQQLSEDLGVGASSVREAIRILSQQKILKVEQGRGTYVEQELGEKPSEQLDFLEKSSIEQLSRARLIIEPELAALVAEDGTMEELKEILKYARLMEKKFLKGEDFLYEDIKFHELIAKGAKNDILLEMVTIIGDLLYESRKHSMRIKSQNEKAVSYHILIAKAINDRNPSQARRLMKAHIIDLLTDLKY
ncbi:FadR/GntR family transcriptional regulator [Alkalicoccus daliensis]|uniref:DNA-binding transcriptional regulator, FadR family n=1 Tax=Alkalicoccus daliensis TaxID=745820 RepID=A0A1H0FWP2_9BACI|nr:FadR/GntR family transcriptional regulator [Alkalicoccus daliensis]SDN98992.1 DNA-binding transcriptional regulator, FadR family [Alkalicoccus daliensis]